MASRDVIFDGQSHSFPAEFTEQDIADALASLPKVKAVKEVKSPDRQTSWSDLPSNIIPSATRFGESLITPFLHPMDTANAIGDVLGGAGQHLKDLDPLNKYRPAEQLAGPRHSTEAIDAIGRHLADRYGGLDNIKNTLIEDPVGFLADASMVLTGGGGLAARAPGTIVATAGRAALPSQRAIGTVSNAVRSAGRAAETVGRAIDPIALVTKPAGFISKYGLGATTGAGHNAIEEAYQAGKEGGPRATAFQEQMRGGDMNKAVSEAKIGLAKMERDKQAAYRADKQVWGNDPAILDMSPIDTSIAQSRGLHEFKGEKGLPDSDQVKIDEIVKDVEDWKKLDPAEYHTTEGLDFLKKKVQNKINLLYKTGSKTAIATATKIKDAIQGEIVAQAPNYAKAMRDFHLASNLTEDIESALSLEKNAKASTALRKLQSIMRNNVTSNYGERRAMADRLTESGSKNLLPMLAGQSLNAAMPRGLHAGFGGAGLAIAALEMHNPAMMAGLAATSPRLVGEGAYYAGKGSNLTPLPARQAALGLGRIEQNSESEEP